jgi:hypothetical protein
MQKVPQFLFSGIVFASSSHVGNYVTSNMKRAITLSTVVSATFRNLAFVKRRE